MRISFVLPSYPWQPIGGFRVVYEYANHLVSRGHHVSVIHSRQLRVPGRRLPRHPYYLFQLFAQAARERSEHPQVTWHAIDPLVQMIYVPSLQERFIPDGDIVVATAWWTARYVQSYSARAGRKFYLIQHDESKLGFESELVDETWRYPLHKVVIAKWLLNKGLGLGIPVDEFRYIPNGIDHSKYRLLRPIGERPRRVAMLAGAVPRKGATDGIRALTIAHEQFPDLTAVLFGVGPRPAELPPWIQYWRDPPQAQLVEDVYNAASIYLCPSHSEGWHLPPAEAMACGCALVSTDIDGVRDYAIDGETALLAPVAQPQALADRIVRLLRDDVLRMNLAEAGYNRIQEYTWERATDSLESWMNEVLTGPRCRE